MNDNQEAMAVNGVFDANDPVQVENLRVRLENDLFNLARQIASCGLVPTITLKPMPTAMGEYEVDVDVRYSKTFYRDPKWHDFIMARMKAAKEIGDAANMG